MLYHVCGCVPGMPEKVGAVIAAEGVGFEHIGKSMERGRGKSVLIDVGESSHGSPIADAQEVEVIRVLAVFRQERNGIQPRTIVVQLSLEPAVLGGKDEVPVAPGAPVVTPMGQG